ncbi:helix-turn-helix transcriptional regulator [Fulvivirga lutea]|uniref:Response regulator transcription factor n=1 Tax=Fulvivirga lutea TaxID=2810512 RepID=A0A974ZZK1_9BACT|nr:response regulator transcription factor [Fulvivirga lutea]QSE96205.1 response regulator transcription factor [Fulvivirga lutea]
MKVPILILDPQFLTRNGLFHLLDNVDILDLDMHESISTVEQLDKYKIIITDYLEPYTVQEKADFRDLLLKDYADRLLIISADREKSRIKSMISQGVKGYLTKDCDSDEILSAINVISDGNRFYCNRVLEMLSHIEGNNPDDCEPADLSNRELEVIQLIAKGYRTADIADELFISVHTVNSHRKNILKKLRLKSPTQLVAYAHEIGLIDT